ncbi:unnamed protein product, partial [Rotaria magnacalcarata]
RISISSTVKSTDHFYALFAFNKQSKRK